jgi:GH24 family phage-related lysozyme (muramidase)
MTDRKVGPKAFALMHHFESCKLVAYRCPADKPTIGWGMTYYPATGARVKMGDRITQTQADTMFEQLVARDFAPAVGRAIGDAPTTAAQFGAMVALAYNIGVDAFAKSTLARLHRVRDYAGAARQFAVWNKAGGKVSNGLIRRRAAEAALYRADYAELTRQTNGDVV